MYNEIRDYIDTQIETYNLKQYSPKLYAFQEGIINDVPEIFDAPLNNPIMIVPYPFELLLKQSTESGKNGDNGFRDDCSNFLYSDEIGKAATLNEALDIGDEQVHIRVNSIRHGQEQGCYLCSIQMTFYHFKYMVEE